MKDFYSFDELSMPYMISALFWGLYMTVFVYAVWKMLVSKPKNIQKKEVSGLFGVLFALYAIFYCINPDYFRYREWINETDIKYWEKENIYIYIVLFCRSLSFDYPYELFRLIVWGGAILLAYCTFRTYRKFLLPGLALLMLFVFHANTFSYARASLAMAVYFFGVALSLRHDKVIPRLLGTGIAVSSYYFHHEMIVAIAALPFLFIPFERKNFSAFSILLLIITIYAISFVGSNLLLLDQLFDNDEFTSRIENVNEKGQSGFRLSTFINYFKYFYPFYLITRYLWKKKVPKSIAGMYRVTSGILILSLAFMVVYGLRSVYTYRILYMAMIPLTLLIGYGYCHGYFKKRQVLLLLLLAVLSNSIRFINA